MQRFVSVKIIISSSQAHSNAEIERTLISIKLLVPAAHGMGAPKASHGDRECESIVPRPRSPFVPFHFSEASVTFSFDLEDLVVSTQIVFLNFSSLSGQNPKFNPRSKFGGTHPTSVAQRASAHLLEREIYIEDRPKSYFGCLRWYPEKRLRRDKGKRRENTV